MMNTEFLENAKKKRMFFGNMRFFFSSAAGLELSAANILLSEQFGHLLRHAPDAPGNRDAHSRPGQQG